MKPYRNRLFWFRGALNTLMRVTVAHKKSKEGVVEAIDRAIGEALKDIKSAPVEVTGLERSWVGYTLTFSFFARAGFMKGPVKGTVEVADTWVIITADPGAFAHFMPEDRAQEAIRMKMRELLA
jgi:hypothetical protein